MADVNSAVKALAIIMTVAFATSAFYLFDLNIKYTELASRYDEQATEIALLELRLNQTEVSLRSLNSTLTSLSNIPQVEAALAIIDRVGVDYFNKYFHSPTVTTYGNYTRFTYEYHIEVGTYSVDRNVAFYLDHGHLVPAGLPVQGNLQPFNVTAEEAIQLALDAGQYDSLYPLEAEIFYDDLLDVRPLRPSADKYVWVIKSWTDPPWARTRGFTFSMVDPISGAVYLTNGRGADSLYESQVDTAEEAAALGITGYVKLHYPELPDQIQIVRGGNFTFTLTASFNSYSEGLPYVKLYLDPQQVDPYQIQSNMADRIRGVLSYDPEGSLTLVNGETVNITATVRFPADEAGGVFLFHLWALDGLGVGTDDTLILSDIGD